MSWQALCADFDKRKPVGKPTGRAYWFEKTWADGRHSVNDLLRNYLMNHGIQYINTLNGDVWFLFHDEWTRCEYEVEGTLVRFYILEFEMG